MLRAVVLSSVIVVLSCTPLHDACNRGQTALAKELLSAGSVVDERSEQNSETALIVASQRRKSEVVELLLASNATVDLRCVQYYLKMRAC